MRKSLRFFHQLCRYRILSPSLVSSVFGVPSLLIFLLFLFFLTIFSPHLCLAVDVTMGWAANGPEENVQGYKIYAGRSSRYDDKQQLKDNFHYEYLIDLNTKLSCSLPDMENCTVLSGDKLSCADLDQENPTCTFLILAKNTAFYFTATAFNDFSESDYSDEAAYLPTTSETDSDGDGISDENEVNICGTDPFAADSDNDGIDDGNELDMWGMYWNADLYGVNVINLLLLNSLL